jgi:hypothetical protein
MEDEPRPNSGPLPSSFPLDEWGGETLETWEDYYRVRDRLIEDPEFPLAELMAESIENGVPEV